MARKNLALALLGIAALLISGCSGIKGGTTSGGGGNGGGGNGGGGNGGGTGGGPFTIGGTILGLTGTGLVLENTGSGGVEDLTITANSGNTVSFTFKNTTTLVTKLSSRRSHRLQPKIAA